MIRNQFARRNLTPFQRAELSLKMEEIFREEGKRHQQEHGGTAPGKPKTLCQNSDEVITPVDTKKELAKIAGVSHDTIHKAKVITEKAPEELKEKARRGEVSVNQAYKEVRATEKAEAKRAIIEKIAVEPPFS